MARRSPTLTFDDLPLFATDEEIGEAVVGKSRAKHYAQVTIKHLEKQAGFPAFDEAHGGRYTPAVRAFYDVQKGIARPGTSLRPQERPENPAAWRKP